MKSRRKSWVAVLLTLLAPGLGHLYVGRIARAVSLFVLFQLVTLFAIPFMLLAPGSWVVVAGTLAAVLTLLSYVVVDAIRLARATDDGFVLRRYNRWYVYAAVVLLVAFILQPAIHGYIKSNIAEAYRIPSASMEPTILKGDYLLVSKLPTSRDGLGRGSLAVFEDVEASGRMFLMRVIGLPKDTVQMKEGVLFTNGRRAAESYVQRVRPHGCTYDPRFAWQRNYLVDATTKRDYSPTCDTWGPIVVPEAHYFVLGDNRDVAWDSRYWGYLPSANIRGRPDVIYYSYDIEADEAMPWITAVRWRRIGKVPS